MTDYSKPWRRNRLIGSGAVEKNYNWLADNPTDVTGKISVQDAVRAAMAKDAPGTTAMYEATDIAMAYLVTVQGVNNTRLVKEIAPGGEALIQIYKYGMGIDTDTARAYGIDTDWSNPKISISGSDLRVGLKRRGPDARPLFRLPA